MLTKIYFTHGKIIAKSGDVKIYEFESDKYLEIGPGHNLWAISSEIVEYKEQMGNKPRGDCLELGLGLGVASNYILSRPAVKFLTTVEINKDIIKTYKKLNKTAKNHRIVRLTGLDYLINSKERYDFIFLDFYDVIDEDTIPVIKTYLDLAKKLLTGDGEIMGWYDMYTPEDMSEQFFELFQ